MGVLGAPGLPTLRTVRRSCRQTYVTWGLWPQRKLPSVAERPRTIIELNFSYAFADKRRKARETEMETCTHCGKMEETRLGACIDCWESYPERHLDGETRAELENGAPLKDYIEPGNGMCCSRIQDVCGDFN